MENYLRLHQQLRYLCKYKDFEDRLSPYSLDFQYKKKDKPMAVETDKVIRLMKYVYYHTIHDGQRSGEFPELTARYLLNECRSGRGITCLMIAVVLQELCLAEGYCARIVQTKSFDSAYLNSHWVTCVFLPQQGTWGMFDATYCVYCTDDDGIVLSIPDIRQRLIEGKMYTVNFLAENPILNAVEYRALQIESYFQFETFLYNDINTFFLPDQVRINLSPLHFDAHEYRLKRLQVEVNTYEEYDSAILQHQNAITIYTHNAQHYWRKPEE